VKKAKRVKEKKGVLRRAARKRETKRKTADEWVLYCVLLTIVKYRRVGSFNHRESNEEVEWKRTRSENKLMATCA
jgi:hypothetical protein